MSIARRNNPQASAALANAWPTDPAAILRALDAGADPNFYPSAASQSVFLSHVARLGPELLARYLEAGADVHAVDATDGNGALHALTMTFADTTPQLTQLLDAGADPNLANQAGRTPVHLAALYGPACVLALLLQRGGDPNALDRYGSSPLHAAAAETERLRLLLQAGANPNQTSPGGETPVHAAAARNNQTGLAALVQAGASVDARRSKDGQTALHASVVRGAVATVQQLVALAADPHLPDATGASALDLALHQRDASLVAALGGDTALGRLQQAEQEAGPQEAALRSQLGGLLRDGGYICHVITPGYKYEADDDHFVLLAAGQWSYRYVDGFHGTERTELLDEAGAWARMAELTAQPGDSPLQQLQRIEASLRQQRPQAGVEPT